MRTAPRSRDASALREPTSTAFEGESPPLFLRFWCRPLAGSTLDEEIRIVAHAFDRGSRAGVVEPTESEKKPVPFLAVTPGVERINEVRHGFFMTESGQRECTLYADICVLTAIPEPAGKDSDRFRFQPASRRVTKGPRRPLA